jgi:hypothetical protein
MGIGAFVALVGFSQSFEREWLKLYESSGTDLAVVQKTFMNTTVNESGVATLLQLPEVAAVSPMILNMMNVTPDVNALIYGWRSNSFEFAPLTIVDGRRFHDGRDLLYEGLRQLSGIWSATQVEVKVSGRPGSSLLIIERGSAKAKLARKDFMLGQPFLEEDDKCIACFGC